MTQTDLSRKHAAVQVSGCCECQSSALVLDGSRDNSSVRCNQLDDLLSLGAELREETERLRTIRDSEQKTD